jgi:very-short-patch-repair endonuclease
MPADAAALARRAASQHGLFTRAQALACGFSAATIGRRVAGGSWRRVADGVYLAAGAHLGFRARCWLGLLLGGPRAVLSHFAAAQIWHLPVVARRVHVTLPPGVRRRSRPRLRWHQLRLRAQDVRIVDGYPVTTLTRTVLDCCCLLSDRDACSLLDHALLHGRVQLERLYAEVRARVGWHGTPRLLRLVVALDPSAQSRAERRLHAGLRRRGLTAWVAQHRVVDEHGHVRDLDVAFPALLLAIEVDGWAWHSEPTRFQADSAAWNRLDALGWHVLHVTWDDVALRLDAVLDEIETRVRQLVGAAA